MRILLKITLSITLLLQLHSGIAQQTFTNPLLPAGADPWSIYHDGYYYYTHTTGRNITIWKTDNIANLITAEKKVVWTPPPTGEYSKEIWAPEIHFLNGKWYVYFSADSGRNINHRVYVIENSSKDPMQGEWVMKGKLKTPEDKWSIDGSLFENKGQMYFIWSGWQGDVNGEQDIYIAKMSNPWTITGNRTLISKPTFDWEKHGDLKSSDNPPHVNVNEGPEVLKHGNKLYLIYSVSGCWTDYYALGMSTASANANLMNASSWTKYEKPVFKQTPEKGVFAPGHNSFFKSPDGKEDWILYHANSKPGQGCGGFRSPRAQRFTWNKDGSPNFGEPVAESVELAVPAGTKEGASAKHNPVFNADFPDPTVINANGTYYAYATQGRHNGKMNNIQLATSKDLFNWTYVGDALPQKPTWANTTQDFWAPHVLYDKDISKYVLFYSGKANDKNYDKCIGVAFAETPEGPFIDKGTPLILGEGFTNIDPMAMVDPKSGKKILYWGSGFAPITVREMTNDWQNFAEGSVKTPLVFPGKEKNYSVLIEGAWMDYNNGKYYLYYSGDNCCGDKANYAVMVARSDNALGPFERLGEANGTGSSVILEKDAHWFAPGHNSIIKDANGNSWIAYHAIWPGEAEKERQNGKNKYVRRVMCINPVMYRNGWPEVFKKF